MHGRYILIYNVNAQINIKPQLAMGLQTLKRWGHDFTRNRWGGGGYSNPWANRVKPNVKGKTHKAVNHPFCIFVPIVYFFQKSVEEVIFLGMGKVWRSNSKWEDHPFWKNVFWLIGQVRAQKFIPLPFSQSCLAPSRSWRWLSSLLHIFPIVFFTYPFL